MSALSYLFIKKTKNRIRCFIRQPLKIISLVLMVAVLGLSFYTSLFSQSSGHRDIDEFYAIVALVYAFLFVNISKNGFSAGASFFGMADINLVFSSPIKSSEILFFGMIEQLGKTIYMGAFVLFQYGLAHQYYDVNYFTLIFVALGYGLTVLFSQMTAMLIYIFSSDSEKKGKMIKTVYYSVMIFFAGFVLYKSDIVNGFEVAKLVAAARNDILYLFPVSGFVCLSVEGACSSQLPRLLIGMLCCIAFAVIYFILVARTKTDFYEDVLKSSEKTHSAITAAKEGRAGEPLPTKIRTGDIGFKRGFGASAVREKHRIENRRGSVFLLSKVSILMIVMTAVYSFIMPGVTGVFVISVYTLIISVASGRWAKELMSPYVYLIPEKPFVKLFNLIWEQIPKVVLESILCFIPVHFVLKCDIIVTVSMIVGRISFGFLFIAANLVMQRLFGMKGKSVLSVMAFILLVTALSLPSVIVGIGISMLIPFNPQFSFFAISIVNIIISPLLLLLCRNVLEYSEYNYR